ncbi:MAG: hypothetical protein COB02_12490 [Candidatus Cloacimonadota bacterium]|nr:MAG: hypothetical protein COB02_12490 [Candidatus Cloacimonadota bacterium]
MNKKCKIGMINFLNGLIPDYHFENTLFTKTYGLPAELNKLLREGDLDISPVSSMEYILNSSNYSILPGLCISAFKEVQTVGVFSNLAPTEWDRKKIYLSGASLTSKYLLKVICKKYLKVDPIFIEQKIEIADKESFEQIIKKYDGVLLIGDRVFEFKNNFQWQFYDLARMWFEATELPFVFALWLVRNNFIENNCEIISKVHYLQLEAIIEGLSHLEEVYEKNSKNLTFKEFSNFLENIMNYQLSPFELLGLKKFSEDLIELRMISDFEGFHFFDSKLQP